jgi:Ca2+/Na+ antiporter
MLIFRTTGKQYRVRPFVTFRHVETPTISSGTVTGLGQTFVGNIFFAASNSLPEVVVSVAAVRMAL